MGRNAWQRFKLGLQNLADLRQELTLHINVIESFVGSLAMAAVGRMEPAIEKMKPAIGRMEPIMQRIFEMLLELLADRDGKCQRAPIAYSDENPATWERLKMELVTKGVPDGFVQANEEDIRSLLDEVATQHSDCHSVMPDESLAIQVCRMLRPVKDLEP